MQGLSIHIIDKQWKENRFEALLPNHYIKLRTFMFSQDMEYFSHNLF